jgi:hypothetical protein
VLSVHPGGLRVRVIAFVQILRVILFCLYNKSSMSKSTPITQLPGTPPPITQQGPPFINDHQKQMVTQAQQAAQMFTMPQNTQVSTDVTVDDDATIQEVLNELNIKNEAFGSPQNRPQEQVQMMPDNRQSIPQPQFIEEMYPQQMQPPVQMPSMQQHALGTDANTVPQINNEGNDNIVHKMYNVVLKDIKQIVILVVVFVGIQLIPVERFVYTYVAALDKIPYSHVIIRALLAGVVAYILLKFVS